MQLLMRAARAAHRATEASSASVTAKVLSQPSVGRTAAQWRGCNEASSRAGDSGRALHGNSLATQIPAASVAAQAKALLVDTLDMMRSFERTGMTRQQAEALTEHMTGILCLHKEKLAEQYVSKATLERVVLEQEARSAGFKSEVAKAQDMHHGTLNRESDRLANDLAKIRTEIRYEIDKLTASQRLDLNLEKGRMRDELQALRDKANELEIKIDKEINMLKAAVEITKNETMKYSLGMMFAFATAGLGAARLFR